MPSFTRSRPGVVIGRLLRHRHEGEDDDPDHSIVNGDTSRDDGVSSGPQDVRYCGNNFSSFNIQLNEH